MRVFGRVAALFLLLLLLAPAESQAAVEQDMGAHQVLGKLYALAASAALGEKNPAGAFSGARVTEHKGELWVGVPVEQFSTARPFLRSHAPELNIMEDPAGQPWMGGETAWLKAASAPVKGKRTPLSLAAAMGSGPDAERLFLGVGDYWWLAPEMKASLRQAILKRWGANPAPVLRLPSGGTQEKITASPVGLPEKMHVGSSGDPMSIGMGDVLFNPIPRNRSSE